MMRYVDPGTRARWNPETDFRFKDRPEGWGDGMAKMFGELQKMTAALHENGARILLGTDTPNPFVVPGFDIHEELELMANL